MIKWIYPRTDEWKHWVWNSDWTTINSWESGYWEHERIKRQYVDKFVTTFAILFFVYIPLAIIVIIFLMIMRIDPDIIAAFVLPITLLALIYTFYQLFKKVSYIAKYLKGYPQNLAHPKKIYREIQIRKKQEGKEYDPTPLGLIETIRWVRRKKLLMVASNLPF
ncbi:MAG: hypothetical protein AB1779_11610 [Candidatus Thermoplasmatota archaeon]